MGFLMNFLKIKEILIEINIPANVYINQSQGIFGALPPSIGRILVSEWKKLIKIKEINLNTKKCNAKINIVCFPIKENIKPIFFSSKNLLKKMIE